MRKVLFWIHLCAGVAAGAVILLMSATGVLLTYERQITEWADGHRVVPPAPEAARLGVEALAARVFEARGPGRPRSRCAPTARRPPHSGSAARPRCSSTPTRARSSAKAPERRAPSSAPSRTGIDGWGRRASAAERRAPSRERPTSASCSSSGAASTCGGPRASPRDTCARSPSSRAGCGGERATSDWHNVFGFWSALPLVFVVASGVVISYPWANALVQRLAGGAPDRAGARPGGPRGEAPMEAPSLFGLDRAWARAEAEVPGWQSLTARVPAAPDAPWVFSIDTSTGARRPDTRTQLTVDRETGTTLKREGYAATPAGRKAIGLAPLHPHRRGLRRGRPDRRRPREPRRRDAVVDGSGSRAPALRRLAATARGAPPPTPVRAAPSGPGQERPGGPRGPGRDTEGQSGHHASRRAEALPLPG